MKFYFQSIQMLKYKIKKNQLQKGTKRKNSQLSQPIKQYLINWKAQCLINLILKTKLKKMI